MVTKRHFAAAGLWKGYGELQHYFTIGEKFTVRVWRYVPADPRQWVKSIKVAELRERLPRQIGILKRTSINNQESDSPEYHSFIRSAAYSGMGASVKIRFSDFLTKRDARMGKTSSIVKFFPVLNPLDALDIETMSDEEQYLPKSQVYIEENAKWVAELWSILEYIEQFQEEESRAGEILHDISLTWHNLGKYSKFWNSTWSRISC